MSTSATVRVSTTRTLNASRARRARRSDEAVRRLVRQAARGEERAWDELVAEYDGLVRSVARSNGASESDAADVSQLTWLRLVRSLDGLHDPARVGAWLATTARRQCCDLRRGPQAIALEDALPEPASDGPAVGDELLAFERDRMLWAAVDDLPVRDRRLLAMLMADPSPSYEEIGSALGMPIGSIGPTRARALVRLRRAARRRGITAVD